jgi:hypothetical protein
MRPACVRHGAVASFLVAAFAAFALVPARAADAPPPLKVLRHLSFDAIVDAKSVEEDKVSGFDGTSASGTQSAPRAAGIRRSTIVVDIVAATADGGLAADVSEKGDGISEPPMRVGITAKALLFDPRRPLSPEASTLLHYLARDFMAAGDIAAGSSWTEQNDAGGTTSRMTYRVAAVDADAKTVDLRITGASSAVGPNGFAATSEGTVTYDTASLVPLAFTVATRSVARSMERTVTTTSTVSATLRDDSFRHRS